MAELTESRSVMRRLAAQRGTPPSEQDRRKAREIVDGWGFITSSDPEAIDLMNRIAAYGEEVRRETWNAAITEVQNAVKGWRWAATLYAAEIIKVLEAAAKK